MKLMSTLTGKLVMLICCASFTMVVEAQTDGKGPIPSDVAESTSITTAAMNSTLIASEQQYIQKVLTSQGVEPQDIALHTSYNNLLISIENELSSNLEAQSLAIKDFELVLANAESDASVKYQYLTSLRQHFNELKENIAVIGKPKAGN